MKRAFIFLVIVALLPVVSTASEPPAYKSNLDYIEKTHRLWGISEVKVNPDKTVTLVDAEIGYGAGLMLSLSEVVKSVTLKSGESCTLSDGHHAFITYELKEIKKDTIIFIVTDKFDARSFGDGIKQETRAVAVSPYRD